MFKPQNSESSAAKVTLNPSAGIFFHALLYVKEFAQNHSGSQVNSDKESSRVMNSACAL